MTLLGRIMGAVAKMSHEGSRQSTNGIPSNWLIVLTSGCVGMMFWSFARAGNLWALLLIAPCLLTALVFATSILKRNTFFVSEPMPSHHLTRSNDATLEAQVRWTGRLRLHEKCAQRFVNMPVDATRLEDGSVAFISRIDASTRYYSVVTESKVGIWLAMPKFESLEIEAGLLYYGFQCAPSLALRFIDGSDGKPSRAILSFENLEERSALLGWLTAEKEKAVRMVAPMGAANLTTSSKTNSSFSGSTSTA